MTILFAAALAGCIPDADRCGRIASEDLHYRAVQLREERIVGRLVQAPGYNSMSADEKAQRLRQLWADDAEEMRNRLIEGARAKGDTQQISMLETEDRSKDSVGPAAPPLRPSDEAWYAEHCYEGKPR